MSISARRQALRGDTHRAWRNCLSTTHSINVRAGLADRDVINFASSVEVQSMAPADVIAFNRFSDHLLHDLQRL